MPPAANTVHAFPSLRLPAAALAAVLLAGAAHAGQVEVKGSQILVDGKPFIPNGAAAEDRLADLKALGATVVRTYGQEPGAILDAAQRAGLKVIAGFWLGHPRRGFDYGNRRAVEAQLEDLRHMVERYRNHPALLMWGIGNEVEVDLSPAEAMAVWPAIEEAARLAKSLDGQHPVMAALAEVGEGKAGTLKHLAPSVDVLGINGYGEGLMSAVARARAQGWTGPIVLAEIGPQGHWDAPRTAWGAPLEPTSTEKADRMRRYLAAARKAGVGAIPLLWGHKQEVTPTWYSLLLPSGEWTGTVEVMAEAWGGHPPGPAAAAPRIRALAFAGPDVLAPGETRRVTLKASDPDGVPLDVSWQVMAESTVRSVGGDPEPVPPSFPEAVRQASASEARIGPLPAGRYRVFATVRDGRGAAATANLPFEVR